MQPPSNLRILLITNMFPSAKDPLFGIFVKNFKAQLEQLGVHFSHKALICGKSQHILQKLWVYAKHYFRVLCFSFSGGYDLVYIHYFSHHIPILWAFFLWGKKPVVVNAHGSDILGVIRNNRIRAIGSSALRRIDLLVVPTEYFKTLILEQFPVLDKDSIYVSPSGGIDRSIFKVQSGTERRSELLTLGFVSRFIEEKGWRVFLDALKKSEENGIRFKALIVGKGPDEELIRNYILQKGLEDKTEVVGFVPQQELPNLYNQLDLYIFPTYREAESLGLTGLEAMSCGIPVIGTDMAGPSTYIREGYNGYLFPARDADTLAKKIALYDKLTLADRKKMSRQAERTSMEYDRIEVADKLYRRLLEVSGK